MNTCTGIAVRTVVTVTVLLMDIVMIQTVVSITLFIGIVNVSVLDIIRIIHIHMLSQILFHSIKYLGSQYRPDRCDRRDANHVCRYLGHPDRRGHCDLTQIFGTGNIF